MALLLEAVSVGGGKGGGVNVGKSCPLVAFGVAKGLGPYFQESLETPHPLMEYYTQS